MWIKFIKDAKLIIGTILVASSLLVGAWSIITSVFITRSEAQAQIKKLDLDTSYNKAFRLEDQIQRMKQHQRPLTREELRRLERYKKDLKRVDKHIDKLEGKIYE